VRTSLTLELDHLIVHFDAASCERMLAHSPSRIARKLTLVAIRRHSTLSGH
jgi:hypothetical protein